MSSMREIRLRIKSVGSTQQITKAMNLVAAAKFQRCKQKLEKTRPYFRATNEVLTKIVSVNQGSSNLYLKERPVNMSTTIVIAGDKGLCGGYNVNICQAAREMNRSKPKHNYILVGAKAMDFFMRRRKPIIKTFISRSEDPYFEDAEDIGQMIIDMYENGETDEVYLAYTEFKSVISHNPKIIKLLPINADDFPSDETKRDNSVMSFEPNEQAVFDYIIPKYINTVIYGAMTEAAACQQGARMTAMDSATENASDMITNYSRQYNRARQGAITQEITEIVSGANALE